MSVFQPTNFSQIGNNSKVGEALGEIIKLFKDIQEFSQDELKAISLLQTDKYYQVLLAYYILNRKHVKRKYAKEILTALDKLANALSQSNNFLPMFGMNHNPNQPPMR